jgi:AbrB family looped-hinge helix DNA binding protein
MRSSVSEKGQVTIPKALRVRLGIRPGDQVEFSESRGRILITRSSDRDPIDEIYGTYEMEMSTDEFIDLIRGPVADP